MRVGTVGARGVYDVTFFDVITVQLTTSSEAIGWGMQFLHQPAILGLTGLHFATWSYEFWLI